MITVGSSAGATITFRSLALNGDMLMPGGVNWEIRWYIFFCAPLFCFPVFLASFHEHGLLPCSWTAFPLLVPPCVELLLIYALSTSLRIACAAGLVCMCQALGHDAMAPYNDMLFNSWPGHFITGDFH